MSTENHYKMLVRSLSMRLSFRKNREKVVEKRIVRKESNQEASTATILTAVNNNSVLQEKQPPKMNLEDEYDLVKTLADGSFAQIYLVTHKQTQTTVVLKAVHAELTNIRDFLIEYQYSYTLSAHPHILSTYEVTFQNENCFFFATEYAPYGDLSNFIKSGGISESHCKTITQQIGSALEFMHSKQLVHRDIKLENVLVFERDLSRVKLCDFGATRRQGSLVSKLRCVWMPFVPPELYIIIKKERYTCQTANDVWQFAILIYFCLTGTAPWQHADYIKDTAYAAFWRYQKRRVTKVPGNFRKFASRLLRMFRRMFEHKPENRSKITEVNKYLKDVWLVSASPTSSLPSPDPIVPDLIENDEYERNSKNYEQKMKMRKALASFGLEITIDNKYQMERIREWIQKSNFLTIPDDLAKLRKSQSNDAISTQ